uniref:OBG-type G domain-containing protein n=1 Tax=Eptatretus burgeri TaxID=7764 RepID=A0A8C4QZF0_EPTBU
MKSGDARVALIGFPSVGKSTFLSLMTSTESECASYEFTTLTCIPGVIEGVPTAAIEFSRCLQGDRRGALRRTCGQTDGKEWINFFIYLFFLPVLLFRLVELLRRT